MTQIRKWLEVHQQLIQLMASCSLAMLVATLVAVSVVIMQLPADYFADRHRHPTHSPRRSSPLYACFVVVKNILGVIVILAGVALLMLPGQGLVTILIGLALTNFPGKFAVERWMVRRRGVGRVLNWIRAKVGRPPFVISMQTEEAAQ